MPSNNSHLSLTRERVATVTERMEDLEAWCGDCCVWRILFVDTKLFLINRGCYNVTWSECLCVRLVSVSRCPSLIHCLLSSHNFAPRLRQKYFRHKQIFHQVMVTLTELILLCCEDKVTHHVEVLQSWPEKDAGGVGQVGEMREVPGAVSQLQQLILNQQLSDESEETPLRHMIL